MKKPFLHALGAAAYIAIIVFVMQGLSLLLKSQNGTFVIPMAVLGMFVLSASIMGFLFLSEPIALLLENKKKEAVVFFSKTVACFAGFVLFFGVLVFAFDKPDQAPIVAPQGKINVDAVCRGALAYMTFANGDDAEKFVTECADGKHPEVMEQYIKNLGLDGAKI